MSLCSVFFQVLVASGRSRGVSQECAPTKIPFNFHAVFSKNFANNRLAAIPFKESWIRHWWLCGNKGVDSTRHQPINLTTWAATGLTL